MGSFASQQTARETVVSISEGQVERHLLGLGSPLSINLAQSAGVVMGLDSES